MTPWLSGECGILSRTTTMADREMEFLEKSEILKGRPAARRRAPFYTAI